LVCKRDFGLLACNLLMHLLAMLAAFEIDRIHERTGEGQKRYRELYARGKVGKDSQRQSRTGKNLPVGRPMKVFARSRAVEMRAQGMSWGKIAKELGADLETVRLAVRKALATA
jgi:putative DNA-invertase from lambdoid prophage Rac